MAESIQGVYKIAFTKGLWFAIAKFTAGGQMMAGFDKEEDAVDFIDNINKNVTILFNKPDDPALLAIETKMDEEQSDYSEDEDEEEEKEDN